MEKKNFNIKSITWHEVTDKIDELSISKVLNENIDLTSYGSGIKNIYFKYICVKPPNTLHVNQASFKDGELNIQLNLSYPHVEENEKKKVMKMMTTLFVISIDLYPELGIPDFNIKRYKKDVERAFEMKE